jgi:hypothetical protein
MEKENLDNGIKPDVSGNEALRVALLASLGKLQGGTHYSGTHGEFRTAFLGDWNDIEKAIKEAGNDR